MNRKILLIEDEPAMRLGVSHTLNHAGYDVVECADGASGLAHLDGGSYDLIITDLRLPDMDGMDILKRSKDRKPDTGVVIITAFPEVEIAVSAIKNGAYDFLSKPFSNDELLLVINRFFRYKDLERENVHLKKAIREKTSLEQFICEGPAMKKVLDLVATVAATDVPVRIAGESGTGKELIANALFNLSDRKDKPFLKINCAAIPENLMESELFGHERGAFSGAIQTQKGKFEAADGGTLFFDEIGDMPLNLQPKLLRVLEDQTVMRIGSTKPIRIDVRMIFATGKNLKQMVADKQFRDDLFYRINVVPIQLPPLRDRKEDIPFLIDHFLKLSMKKFGKTGLEIPPAAYQRLLQHDYPGNVRELRNAIERAVLLSPGKTINEAVLPTAMRDMSDKANTASIDDLPLQEGINAYERQRILKALDETDGKKNKAADLLGISRKVLWKKMKDLGIE